VCYDDVNGLNLFIYTQLLAKTAPACSNFHHKQDLTTYAALNNTKTAEAKLKTRKD